MSIENVERFYAELERDPVLREEALSLQRIHEEQEEVIDAFIRLAERSGFPFTQQEFLLVLYRRAESQPDA